MEQRERRRRAPARVSDRDLRLLAFAAQHRVILAAHVQALEGIATPEAAARRLGRLVRAGQLRSERRIVGLRWWQIERRGLRVLGSELPGPGPVDLATYEHDVGLGWLWLAARRGAFGAPAALASERQMRSQDRRAPAYAERHSVPLLGGGPRAGERRHYPDLRIETRAGHRIAIELELTSKPPRRREEILSGYALDPRIDRVLYLVDRESVGRAIARSAAQLGLRDLVHVQTVAFGPRSGAISPGRARQRVAARTGEREGGR